MIDRCKWPRQRLPVFNSAEKNCGSDAETVRLRFGRCRPKFGSNLSAHPRLQVDFAWNSSIEDGNAKFRIQWAFLRQFARKAAHAETPNGCSRLKLPEFRHFASDSQKRILRHG